MSRSTLILVNAGFRLANGAGALLAPSKMAAVRMVPDTEERPDARLFVRGFGVHQVAVAAIGLGSRRWTRLERPALVLAIAIDVVDMVPAVVEARDRKKLDADVLGGLALSAAGVATASAALQAGFRRDRGALV